ncbi:MAG TPA: DUF2877 domain-containing protein, partial [Anaerolineales bacterium]|nr:DUF2877 domain-containing protein [Anaerolineales bacterium]
WEKLYIKRDEIHYQLMSLREPQFATKQSPDQFGECSGQTSAALPKTIPIIHELISSLVIADAPASSVSAKQLAGLGVGLTPSGDDLMLGAVYATWIIHPYDTAKALAEEIANIAAPLTTSLSAAWLRSAGRGEAGILWHQFFDALITAEHTQIQEATDNILAVGETSGADALMGFMKTFENWGRVQAD